MKQLIKRMIQMMKAYAWWEGIGFLLTVLYALSAFGSPIVSKFLIDEVIPTDSTHKLYWGLGLFFVVCVSQPIVGYFKDRIFLTITERVTYDIREKMFSKVLRAPMSFFDRTHKGDIVSRLLNDGRSSSQFITNFFVVFIKNILMIITIVVGMLYLSASLTMIVAGLFVVFFGVNWIISKRFNKLALEQQENYDRMCTSINQMADSILTIKAFSVEPDIQARFQAVLTRCYKANKNIMALNILLNNLANVLVVLSLCVIYGLGTLSVMQDTMTLGTVIGMGLYFQLLVQPVYELLDNNIELNKTIPIFDRVFEYMEMENEALDGREDGRVSGDIRVHDVSFSYKEEGSEALRDLSLVIPGKGLSAFIGPSGSGKSTLVKLLLKLYAPSSGSIRIGEETLDQIETRRLRENVSFVSQDIDLLNASIRDNIRCGNAAVSDQEMERVCRKLKLHDKIAALPDGYDSIVTERVNLSGGEKQRLSIARALVKRPSLFIFDEPTSALDPENELIIRETLEELAHEHAVIVIAHKMTTIVHADTIFVFEEGRVVESGQHESLLETNGRYADFLRNPEPNPETCIA
ncbi:ABC transporter ATP-binding protein [Gorillibacterium sp. CAU 1737]|uniref:ABC transporter ATP-binding protein n=1 Tax=Gorillibacterium sp. CAU 1737 TaxID=3140362 RepID=UPI003260C60B